VRTSFQLHNARPLTSSSRFRWVFCQLDALRQCLPSSLRRTLAELPESLDETYERIVKDIKKGNRADAYRMLQCLAVAIRPLSVAELAELLAFDFDANATKGGIPKLNSKWRWGDHEQAVLSTCSSLITIVPTDDSPVVQFSHFSVKEFLLSDRLSTSAKDISQYHIALEDANTLIAKASLGVLLRDPVDESGAATSLSPLALYAAEHWVAHAKVENVASCIRNGMESLFDPDRPYFSAWIKLYNADTFGWSEIPESKMRPEARPLHHAAFIGFPEIVERLALNYPQFVNVISGPGGTALHAASEGGHVEVVRLLLKCDADVDARGPWDRSPLQLASIVGHLDVVQCLLDHGADPNFRDDDHKTPLTLAAVGGHLEIVRLLFEHNADIFTQTKDGSTPLHRVFTVAPVSHSYGDHRSQVVQFLLECGTNPNARDNKHQTPLHLAALSNLDSSQLDFVRILLVHGADVDAEDGEGRTPSQVALENGQAETAELFSEYHSK
jgi:ankyrin repeat protein